MKKCLLTAVTVFTGVLLGIAISEAGLLYGLRPYCKCTDDTDEGDWDLAGE